MLHEYIAYRVNDDGEYEPVSHNGQVRTIKLRQGDDNRSILYSMRSGCMILWDGKRKTRSRGRRKSNAMDYTQLRSFEVDRYARIGDDGITIMTKHPFGGGWVPTIYLIKADLDPSYVPAWLKD